METEVVLALITFMGAITAGFFKLISDQNKTHVKLSRSMDAVAKSNEKIAKETKELKQESKRGNDASERRNGHLGELIIQQGEQTKEIASAATDRIIGVVSNVKNQHVVTQTIEQSTVKDETVQNEVVEAKSS